MSEALFKAIKQVIAAHKNVSVDEVRLTQADVDLVNRALLGTPEAPAAESDPILLAQLKIDEGCRLVAYLDTEGVWTIGYGHTGPEVKRGLVWTQAQAEAALVKDIREHNANLTLALPWVSRLDPVRRRVLQNMAFNLGIGSAQTGKGLLGFKNTLAMVQTGQYADAAENMLKSKWAGQVGDRAKRLSRRMKTGAE